MFTRLGSNRTCLALSGSIATIVVSLTPATAMAFQPMRAPNPRYMVTDLGINLRQAPSSTQLFAGAPTLGWSYTGTVTRGPASTLVPVPNSYLGPTIHAWRGQQVTINIANQIGEPAVTHWHGLDVPADMDGYPTATTQPNESFTYTFPIHNRAGTYWYHPHTDMQTVEQVFAGMAGYFIVHDEEEAKLGLPSGEFDLPVCIQDTTFDANNQRIYNASMLTGYFGATMLVNGWPNYVHSAATRVYRLRLLNGSVSRIYKLAFSDGTPMVAIGTDGGLLDIPRTYPYIMLAPGERVEVWADFRNKPVGSRITLQSLAFVNSGSQGSPVNVMQFSIDRAQVEQKTLPAVLSTINPYRLQDAVNAANPKVYPINVISAGGHIMFTINGGLWLPNTVATNEVSQCDTLEVIQITNTSGFAIIPHPIHFHGRQFQMLDRSVTPAGLSGWNTVKDGLIMNGWKDTFLIMPYETVRILVRHSSYPGMFVYHCHNLEHEDMSMMRNFLLVP